MPSPVGAESFDLADIAEADRLSQPKTLEVGKLTSRESGIIFWTLVASGLLEAGESFEDNIDEGTSFTLTDVNVKGRVFTWLEFSTSDTGGGGAFVTGPSGLQLVAVAGDSEFRGCQLRAFDAPPSVDVECRHSLKNPFDNDAKVAASLDAFVIDAVPATKKSVKTELQIAQIVAASNSKSLNAAFKNSDDKRFQFARLRKASNAESNRGTAIDYDYVSYLDDGVRIGRVFFAGTARAVARVMADDESGDRVLGCFPKAACKVTSAASAANCVRSLDIPEGEEPNSVGATSVKRGIAALNRVVQGLGFVSEAEVAKLLEGKSHLAVLNQHFDEDEIIYFAVPKGKKSVPVPLFSFALPDLDPYPTSVFPMDWSLGVDDIDDWHYDDFEEAFQNADFDDE